MEKEFTPNSETHPTLGVKSHDTLGVKPHAALDVKPHAILDAKRLVEGLLLGMIAEFELEKKQTVEKFKDEVGNLLRRLVPHYHFAIYEKCWNENELEEILISSTVFIEGKQLSVKVFESGKISCKTKDLKKKAVKVYSSGFSDVDQDVNLVLFERKNLHIEKEFKKAYEKLEKMIPEFHNLLKIIQGKLAPTKNDPTLKNIEVPKSKIEFEVKDSKSETEQTRLVKKIEEK